MKYCYALSLCMITGCMSAGEHSARLHSSQEQRLTVGVVQKEIRNGMSQADVAASLGSPNIVTKDAGGTETWIYDKIATEASYSNDSGGISGMAGAGGTPGRALVLGGIGAGYNASSGAAATSQRTLTVIIKFDNASLVFDFSYHSSRF